MIFEWAGKVENSISLENYADKPSRILQCNGGVEMIGGCYLLFVEARRWKKFQILMIFSEIFSAKFDIFLSFGEIEYLRCSWESRGRNKDES